MASRPVAAGDLSPAAAAEVETAYAELKAGHPDEARTRFLAVAGGADLAPEPRAALERAAAWCDLTAGKPDRAVQALEALANRGEGTFENSFLLGLARFQQGDRPKAEALFAHASAQNPTDAEILFLWGDILRRQGKPRESIEKLRGALRRNRLETTESFYQLKLWFSQLQAGGTEGAEASEAIDHLLHNPNPPSVLPLAAAARALSQNHPAEAAEILRRARPAIDPTVWTLTLQDPSFSQENWRPEWAGFFR